MKKLFKVSAFVLFIFSKLAYAMESQPASPKMEVVEESPVVCQGLNEGVAVPPEITEFMAGNATSGQAVISLYPMKYDLIKNDPLSNKFRIRIFSIIPYYSEEGAVDLSDGVYEFIGEWDLGDPYVTETFELLGGCFCRYRQNS